MADENEDIEKEWSTAELHIKNIVEGGKINRFNFTKSEERALDFALRVVSANRQELHENDASE